jgi:hypothetical protein
MNSYSWAAVGDNNEDAPGVFVELKVECNKLSEKLFSRICSVCSGSFFEALWKYDKK